MMFDASHTWPSSEVQVSRDTLLTWTMGSPGAHTKVLGNSGPRRGKSVTAGGTLRQYCDVRASRATLVPDMLEVKEAACSHPENSQHSAKDGAHSH